MTSTPPRGQGWAAIRSRIAFAPAIVTTSARKGWSPGATTQAEVCAMPTSVPEVLAVWMQPFGCFFTSAVWRHVLVLVAGVVLAPGRRTVTAALRVMGLDQEAGFAVYHRVLSLGRWSSRAIAHRLLLLLVAALVPQGPVVIGLDDTIERRWGAKIKARGIYRDPVRSSHGHLVKASGLRWLCVMLLAPIPWAGCVWALPFLTVLAPSEHWSSQHRRRHKKLTDWARQALLQTARWLPGRRVIAVGDSSFSAIELLREVGRHLCMISRLRLDAGLYEPAPPRPPGTLGRPRGKGARPPNLSDRPGRPRHILAPGQHQWLVWPERAPARHRLGHSPLASPREAGADPLGAGARSRGRERATGLPVHRPGCRPRGHPALVRPPLAGGDHLRGSAAVSRPGNPAAMVGSGHPAHHAGAARPVLARDAVGGPARSGPRSLARVRPLVPETRAHVQRRPRPGPARTVDGADFRVLARSPRRLESPS